MIEWLKKILFRKQLEELNRIEAALEKKYASENTVYIPIRIFRGIDKEYYAWICNTLSREEYRYMIFDLRENIIREMTEQKENDKIARNIGRLDMLNIIDNYMKRYKHEYEDSIRRDIEDK